jgi:EmrB/QacA subfamily drug resistance transporter
MSRENGLGREVWMVATVVIIGALMSILDTTIVNVALQTLERELHSPLSTIQWVSTGYLLALATVIPLTGWAAERFGAKRVWMTAVAGFTVTSGLAGLAWSADSLIAIRVLQGLAGGMIMPVGMMTLAQTAGPERMGRVMSVVGVPMLLGPVLGPVIGGLLVTNFSWRWIFWVNLPVGAIGLMLAARLLPSGRAAGEKPLDVLGFALVGPGLAAMVFGLSEISTHGGVSALGLAPLVVGAVMLVAFVRHELRTPHALVDIRLFRQPGFAAAAATIFCVGAGLFGAMLLLPLYYQGVRGLSALDAGLLLAPQGIGAAIGMFVGGRLTDRVGGGRVVVVGLLVLTLGTLPFATVGAGTSELVLSLGLVVRGLGLGGTMMPAMAAAYATLSRDKVPRATPMLNVVQRVGGSFGTAILAVVLETSSAGARSPSSLADAFARTYWWAAGIVAVALVPATVLAVVQTRAARAKRTSAEATPAAVVA